MKRREWLAGRRAAVKAQYDAESTGYDAEGGDYPTPLHGAFVDRLVATTPPGGRILDAACGTGKWFARVADAGRRVVGVDQSAGMLAGARAKGIAEATDQVGLQELSFASEFDAAMVIDAMENIPPEDWPTVVANLRRALRPGGHLYLTLEEQDEGDVAAAFEQLSAAGEPAVLGEVTGRGSAGYHFYPGRSQALVWLTDGGFEVLAEEFDQQPGWGYRHLLLRAID